MESPPYYRKGDEQTTKDDIRECLDSLRSGDDTSKWNKIKRLCRYAQHGKIRDMLDMGVVQQTTNIIKTTSSQDLINVCIDLLNIIAIRVPQESSVETESLILTPLMVISTSSIPSIAVSGLTSLRMILQNSPARQTTVMTPQLHSFIPSLLDEADPANLHPGSQSFNVISAVLDLLILFCREKTTVDDLKIFQPKLEELKACEDVEIYGKVMVILEYLTKRERRREKALINSGILPDPALHAAMAKPLIIPSGNMPVSFVIEMAKFATTMPIDVRYIPIDLTASTGKVDRKNSMLIIKSISSEYTPVWFRPELREGIWRITFMIKNVDKNFPIDFGLIDDSYSTTNRLGKDQHSCSFRSDGFLMFDSKAVDTTQSLTSGVLVSFEVNLSLSRDPSLSNHSTLHCFLNDVQLPVFISRIPQPVRFAIGLSRQEDCVQLVSFEQLDQPSAVPIRGSKAKEWITSKKSGKGEEKQPGVQLHLSGSGHKRRTKKRNYNPDSDSDSGGLQKGFKID
ncbi:hypothetical protein BLNAU_3390 [Blattamonas nauphoetae]|uniref:AP-3 complex subunit delta n=1 Tax=Blattamonas nauphoetae TaxID=2049346 RepID=A0ABQ9YCU9_9EUKA|nr:hypothetical protein BLNAU_3390 [Blattamonas nauphoetae]